MRLFLIFFCGLLTNHASACLSAGQNRIFPIGETAKGLAVVETHLHRTEFYRNGKNSEEMQPGWLGTSYFNIYDTNYQLVYTRILDSIPVFHENNYQAVIGKTFKKGIHLAETYLNFVAVTPTKITFCDYAENCSNTSITFDTVAQVVNIVLPDQSVYPVIPLKDTNSIAAVVLDHYRSFSDDGSFSFSHLNRGLYINSIRNFNIGKKQLIVLHIGRGDHHENADGSFYPPGEEYSAKFPFEELDHSIFTEPVLHHGQGFDFFILR